MKTLRPMWMNAYQCVVDRSFEEYVQELPAPEELVDKLQQRKHIFCWLHSPKLEDVMVSPGKTTQMELIGAAYMIENGSPVQSARFYRYTNLGEYDFIMVTEDGLIVDNLTFEEMIEEGANLDTIQADLK